MVRKTGAEKVLCIKIMLRNLLFEVQDLPVLYNSDKGNAKTPNQNKSKTIFGGKENDERENNGHGKKRA